MRGAPAPTVVSGSSSWAWWIVFPLAAAAGLRFYGLGSDSVWFDEAVSIRQGRLPFWDMIEATSRDNYPPLHNITLFISLRLFGINEFAARLPSALCDLSTVGLVFLLGRRLATPLVGLTAACLVALSPFHISYAQEARMYALLACCATLSVFTLVRFLDQRSWGRGLAYVFATTLLLYSHFYALFVVAAENLFVAYLIIRYRDAARRVLIDWTITQVAVLAAFGFWLPTLIERMTRVQGGFWIPPPSLDTLHSVLRTFAGGETALVLSAFGLVGIAWTAWRRDPQPPLVEHASQRRALTYWDVTGLLTCWFAATVLVPFALSFVIQPLLIPRYTIAASPAWYLLVAAGLCAWSRGRPWRALTMTGVLVATTMTTIERTYTHPWNSDWRKAVAFVEGRAPRGGAVFFPVFWEVTSYRYYARRDDIRLVYSQKETSLPDGGNTWVVTSRRQRFCDPDGDAREAGTRVVERQEFYGLVACRLQGEQEPAPSPSERDAS